VNSSGRIWINAIGKLRTISSVRSVEPESTTTTCRGASAAGSKMAVSVSPMKRASFLARMTIETLRALLRTRFPPGQNWLLASGQHSNRCAGGMAQLAPPGPGVWRARRSALLLSYNAAVLQSAARRPEERHLHTVGVAQLG
jgi:hypothetical protein